MNALFLLAVVLFGIVIIIFAWKLKQLENRIKIQEEILNEYRKVMGGGNQNGNI